jgi:hypothetical protein
MIRALILCAAVSALVDGHVGHESTDVALSKDANREQPCRQHDAHSRHQHVPYYVDPCSGLDECVR